MSRWSVVFVQPDAPDAIASTAGLPADNGIVFVLPPMSLTPLNRNCGSVFWRSPVAVNPQSAAVSRLWPCEVIVPKQFDAVAWLETVLDATIEFSTEMAVPDAATKPPALVVAGRPPWN